MTEGAQMSDAQKERTAVKFTEAEPVPLLYTNFAELTMSIFDLRITFGVVKGRTNNGLEVERLAQVMMSPQHAKSLYSLLSKRIEYYEKQFGPIPTGPLAADKEEEATSAT